MNCAAIAMASPAASRTPERDRAMTQLAVCAAVAAQSALVWELENHRQHKNPHARHSSPMATSRALSWETESKPFSMQ